jgi:hypothetical protein
VRTDPVMTVPQAPCAKCRKLKGKCGRCFGSYTTEHGCPCGGYTRIFCLHDVDAGRPCSASAPPSEVVR